jgi:glycosyltransferase involved in cell wall biosynthesis
MEIPLFFVAGEKPFITIGLSVRNEEENIAHCLRGILKQDILRELPADRKEIIVCDNSSTDRTREIVKEFQKQHPEIKLVSSGAKSKAAGINKIMQVANPKAKIVCFFDGDVVPRRDAVRTLVDFLHRHKEYNIASGKVLLSPMAARARLKVASEFRYPMNIFARIFLKGKTKKPKTTGVSGAVFAIRREAFRPIPSNIMRDDFYLSLAIDKIAMVEKAVVYHRAKTKERLLASEERARIGRLQLEELFGKKRVRRHDRERYRRLFEMRKLNLAERLHYPLFVAYFKAKQALQEIRARRKYPKIKHKLDGSFNTKPIGSYRQVRRRTRRRPK